MAFFWTLAFQAISWTLLKGASAIDSMPDSTCALTGQLKKHLLRLLQKPHKTVRKKDEQQRTGRRKILDLPIKNRTFLSLYIELNGKKETHDIANMVDEQLKVVDTDYRDIESYLHYQPVRVTLLAEGTFRRYAEEKTKEGADLAQMKPPRINPPEALVRRLLQLSQEAD